MKRHLVRAVLLLSGVALSNALLLPLAPSATAASAPHGAPLVASTVTLGGQPYGGCVEAIDYPRSDGANWCRKHGWTVTSRILVRPDKMVLTYRHLPKCTTEDQPFGPCRWNFGAGRTGDGGGFKFWVSRGGSVHYVNGMAR